VHDLIGSASGWLTGIGVRFQRDEAGGVAIEYAMIAAFIGAAVSAFIWGTGDAMMSGYYDKLIDLFS
jgi:Flp pilus assembly pilin Flp